MEALIKGIDPLAYAVILLSVRFVLHAVDTVWEKAAKDKDGTRNWYEVVKSLLKLGLVGAIPAIACVKSGVNGLPAVGGLGSVMSGLSISAIITGLHNLGKRKKPSEGEE